MNNIKKYIKEIKFKTHEKEYEYVVPIYMSAV